MEKLTVDVSGFILVSCQRNAATFSSPLYQIPSPFVLSVKKFLHNTEYPLARQYHPRMEVQVNVAKDDGEIMIKRTEDGMPVHNRSPFSEYGINVAGFQVTDWGF